MLQTVKCKCGKTLLEAYSGEIVKICPKCGTVNHVLIYSNGIVDLRRDLRVVTVKEESKRMDNKDWIQVSKNLPVMKDGLCSDKVLVALGVKDKQISFGWLRGNEWVTSDMVPFTRQELITHWMPLCKPI
jgi:phage FluMu protein Com